MRIKQQKVRLQIVSKINNELPFNEELNFISTYKTYSFSNILQNPNYITLL